MNTTPESNDKDGLSRRDFVQGRFWRALRRKRSATESAAVESPPAAKRRPLVMRYPKSLGDVMAGDQPESQGRQELGQRQTTTSGLPASAARRRVIPVWRPPGAIDEESFLARCTRCEECIEACPHDAIVHAPIQLREAAGTPVIDADHRPCLMCSDFPCIAACQPGVLSRLIPQAMGTAKVTEHLCLAHHGTTCTVCSERCPVPDAISVEAGKPTVSESACTGCGVCRYVCPAPENAILLMPAFHRPAGPAKPLS